MPKALRDQPNHVLKENVALSLQNLIGDLLVAANAGHNASIHLTLDAPEHSAALGNELDIVAHRLAHANKHLQTAMASWEVLIHRANPKLKRRK